MKRKSRKATGLRTRSRAASRVAKPVARHASSGASRADPAVSALLRELAHPLAHEIELVRGLVLDSSPAIAEGVKWNSASYRTTDWFATVHWRNRDSVQLVFHTSAKMKASAQQGVRIADPAGLVK